LYVDPRGVYSTIPGVECWGEDKDARTYAGPHPVVAHPPCTRWCRLAGLVEARWGHKRGEDGGCFAAALEAVRTWGGVLEHPAYTDAFAAYGLPAPVGVGSWQRCLCGGWVAHVDQGHYGHRARKSTWLYAYGIASLPSLPSLPSPPAECLVSWCGNHVAAGEDRPRLSSKEAAATPLAFAELLIAIARDTALPSQGRDMEER